MARRERRGTGLYERDVLVPEPSDYANERAYAQAFFDAIEQNCIAKNVRDRNAEHVRDVLAEAYGKMDPVWFCRDAPQHLEVIRAEMSKYPSRFVQSYFGEGHAYSIMQEWLDAYDHLAGERRKVSPDIEIMISLSEDLGKLQERLWWRAGIDPETKAPREKLALERKNSRLKFAHHSERNHARKQDAQRWLEVAQRLADAYWQRRPGASKSITAQAVLRDWPTDDDAPTAPSISSIRQKIVKPQNT